MKNKIRKKWTKVRNVFKDTNTWYKITNSGKRFVAGHFISFEVGNKNMRIWSLEQEKYLDNRFSKLEVRMDKVEQRLDKVEQRLERLEKKVDEGFFRLEKMISAISAKLS